MRYLQISFLCLFAASFGLIIAERSRLSQEQERAPEPLPLARYVAGDALEPGLGIQDYRDIAITSLIQINKAISAAASGEAASADLIQAYQSLLEAPVPPLYRSLHTSLIFLAKEAVKGEFSDINFLKEKQTQLYMQYPWLPAVSDQP